jgi:hypothetical protein
MILVGKKPILEEINEAIEVLQMLLDTYDY